VPTMLLCRTTPDNSAFVSRPLPLCSNQHDQVQSTKHSDGQQKNVVGCPAPLFRISAFLYIFTATCFSNVAVMGSLDVRLSVCPSVRNVGDS